MEGDLTEEERKARQALRQEIRLDIVILKSLLSCLKFKQQ